MAIYDMGFLMRQMRLERKITQEQLCRGLCPISTLSRIERGLHTPTGYLFRALMGRLGFYSGKHYSDFVRQEDLVAWQNREALNGALAVRDVALAERLISQLHGAKDFNKGLGLQFILNRKVAVMLTKTEMEGLPHGGLDACMRMTMESLNITIPCFDESKISEYMLSHEEVMAVNCLAGIYLFREEYEKAAQVLYAIKGSMDKYCLDKMEKSKGYPTILSNLAEVLHKLGRYEEAISACVLGRESCICIGGGRAWEVPLLLMYHGQCLVELDRKEEAAPILRESYYTFRAMGIPLSADQVAQYYRERFNEEIDTVNQTMYLACTKRESEARPVACTACGSGTVHKSGVVKGTQRYKCKACGRQFVPTRRGNEETVKLTAALLYRNGLSLRAIARLCAVSPEAVRKWVMKYTQGGGMPAPSGSAALVELEENLRIEQAGPGGGKLVIVLPLDTLPGNRGVVIAEP